MEIENRKERGLCDLYLILGLWENPKPKGVLKPKLIILKSHRR